VALLALGLWPAISRGAALKGAEPPDDACTSCEPAFSGAGGFLDEDWLFDFADTDRNYTMGLGFAVSGDFIRAAHLSKPVEAFDFLLGTQQLHGLVGGRANDGARRFEHTLSVLGAGYTPNNLTLTEPDRTDRPYASIILLQVARTTLDTRQRHLFRTALGVGLLGTGLAGAVQTWIHEESLKRFPNSRAVPLGWHNQISDGGELTLLYSVAYARELSRSPVHDVSGQLDGSLGYHSGVSGGLLVRLGLLRSAFWNLPGNPLTEVDGLTAGNYAALPSGRFELYAYGSLRSGVVLYDVLLQGQFRHSRYTLRADQISRVVHDVEFGAAAAFCGFSLSAAIAAVRSPEHFADQLRSHIWGGINFTYQVLRPGSQCRF
jgi:hypothetical protein